MQALLLTAGLLRLAGATPVVPAAGAEVAQAQEVDTANMWAELEDHCGRGPSRSTIRASPL